MVWPNSKRILKELNNIQKEKNEFYDVIALEDDSKCSWKVVFSPPEGSPYHGGKFQLIIDFNENYPFKPPQGYFKTRIYHYLVKFDEADDSWKFCNHCLFEEHDWSPARQIKDILNTTFLKFFTDLSYCIDGPRDPALGKQCKENRDLYIRNAQEETAKYASL